MPSATVFCIQYGGILETLIVSGVVDSHLESDCLFSAGFDISQLNIQNTFVKTVLPAGPVHHDAALHKIHERGEGIGQGSIFQRGGGVLRVFGGDGVGEGIANMSFRFVNGFFSGKSRLAVLDFGAAVRDRDILAVISAQDGRIGKGFAVCGIFDDSRETDFPTLAGGDIPHIYGKQTGFHVKAVSGVFSVYQHTAIDKAQMLGKGIAHNGISQSAGSALVVADGNGIVERIAHFRFTLVHFLGAGHNGLPLAVDIGDLCGVAQIIPIFEVPGGAG